MGHVFISYSSHDAALVGTLQQLLADAGFSVWIDREGISGGLIWRRQIVEAIYAADVVLLVLSANSVSSGNVRKELDIAEEGKKLLLPVEIESVDVPKDIVYHLAGVQRINFMTDSQVAGKRLLEALNRIAPNARVDVSTVAPLASGALGSRHENSVEQLTTHVSGGGMQRTDSITQANLRPDKSKPAGVAEFKKVWFRAADHFSRAVITAYSASGSLSISVERILFDGPNETVVIRMSDVTTISRGRLLGDRLNRWSIVEYGEPTNRVGFRNGSMFGWGTDTESIQAALETAFSRFRSVKD